MGVQGPGVLDCITKCKWILGIIKLLSRQKSLGLLRAMRLWVKLAGRMLSTLRACLGLLDPYNKVS